MAGPSLQPKRLRAHRSLAPSRARAQVLDFEYKAQLDACLQIWLSAAPPAALPDEWRAKANANVRKDLAGQQQVLQSTSIEDEDEDERFAAPSSSGSGSTRKKKRVMVLGSSGNLAQSALHHLNVKHKESCEIIAGTSAQPARARSLAPARSSMSACASPLAPAPSREADVRAARSCASPEGRQRASRGERARC